MLQGHKTGKHVGPPLSFGFGIELYPLSLMNITGDFRGRAPARAWFRKANKGIFTHLYDVPEEIRGNNADRR